jgi:hypothetical protein
MFVTCSAVKSIQQEADAAGEGGKAEFMHIELNSLRYRI